MFFDGDTGLIPLLGFTTPLCSSNQPRERLQARRGDQLSFFRDLDAWTWLKDLRQRLCLIFPTL